MKYIQLLAAFLIGVAIYFSPHPEGLSEQAWHLFAIFIATIIGIVLNPFPSGCIAFFGLGVVIVTQTLPFSVAFSGFSNDIVWLIVMAIFIARGIIKTGLGRRISFFFVRLLGRHTLGLGYGMVMTDLFLAPFIPSSSARSGGIMLPIVESLADIFDSKPYDPSARRLGAYLTQVTFQSTNVTSSMFLTSMAANPLVVDLARDFGFEITWGLWATAAIVPGLVCLALIPYFLYWIYPPEIRQSPSAVTYADTQLKSMGKVSREQWLMIIAFFLLLILWIFGPMIGMKAATAAIVGLIFMLITNVLSWKDVKGEENAWETLFWFSVLLMMATQLNRLGFTDWIGEIVTSSVKGIEWHWGFILLSLAYFYSHYLFASNLAHVGAMYSAFLSVAVAIGTPVALAALTLGFFSGLLGCLTHYSCGPAVLLFGAHYIPVRKWWELGFIMSVFNIVIWLTVGGAWWKFLELW